MDLVFLAGTVVLFVALLGLVIGCDRLGRR
jgi:hypothetical protein